jgi:hypothetical protein
MAKLIKQNGETFDVEPNNGTDYNLKELEKFVGGYIEILYLSDKLIMIVNDEGAYDKKPNKVATDIYRMIHPGFIIFGDVLICKKEEVK